MRFSGWSFPVAVAVSAALLAALIALQFLRTRPQRVRVISTLLWQEVLASAQARSVWHRLQQWRSLILLAIAVLCSVVGLWKNIAAPEKGACDVVLVIDTGLSMGATIGGERRIDRARREAGRIVSQLSDRDRLTVILSGLRAEVIHSREEPVAAARDRVARIASVSAPSYPRPAMQLAEAILMEAAQPELVWISDRPLNVPPDDTRIRIHPILVGSVTDNAGLLSATFVPSANPSVGSIVVRVGCWADQPLQRTLSVRKTDRSDAMEKAVLQLNPNHITEWKSSEVQADGSTLVLKLAEPDSLDADNELRYQLPRRPFIVAQIDPDCPPMLTSLVDSLPARHDVLKSDATTLRVTKHLRLDEDRPVLCVVTEGTPVSFGTAINLKGDSRPLGTTTSGVAVPVTPSDGDRIIVSAGAAPLMVVKRSEKKAILISESLLTNGGGPALDPRFIAVLAREIRELCGWQDGSQTQTTAIASPRSGVDEAPIHIADQTASNTKKAITPHDAKGIDAHLWSWQAAFFALALIACAIDLVLHAKGKVV